MIAFSAKFGFFSGATSASRVLIARIVLEAIEALFGAAMFYYIARFVDTPALQQALPQGGSYFAFSLVGFVFLDYLNAALDTFDRGLEESRDTGTLEHLLITQTSLPVFVAGSAIYPFVATTLRIVHLHRLGSSAFWISVARRELARGFARLAGHIARLLRARNSFRELSSCCSSAGIRRSGFFWEF